MTSLPLTAPWPLGRSSRSRRAASAQVHVYAQASPGKAIALSIEAQPGLVTQAQYPSEDATSSPEQHVQVYQRPFRIVQDVSVIHRPKQAALKGSSCLKRPQLPGVRRQTMFTPQSVPLTWTVRLRNGPRAPTAISRRLFLSAALAGARTRLESLGASPRLRSPPHASRQVDGAPSTAE
jgi:hypothetical protein